MLQTIRTYRNADHDAVVALWNEVFPDPKPWNDPAEAIRRKLAVQRELFFVAEVEGRIVGSAMGGYDGHRGWVYFVATDPRCRRRGIGSALMQRVEEELTALGCAKVNLQVRANNTQVVAFYESLGYAAEQRVSMGKLLDTKHANKDRA